MLEPAFSIYELLVYAQKKALQVAEGGTLLLRLLSEAICINYNRKEENMQGMFKNIFCFSV